ncbi:MAG: DUF2335 domain-containing protein [Acetobacter indonesiensis]|nr:DUF2335 domain-containing protein [Acetobacter indonesiensis]MCI1546180.1 DUF2335 domain-containing protein [Acetobacter indonesiensis]
MQNPLPPDHQKIPTNNHPDALRMSMGGIVQPQSGTQTIAQFAIQHHTGPLPPASELAAYDKIKPDLVERILCMAEANGASEREQIRIEQRNYFWLNLVGRIFGFIFALAGLGATIWLCINGYEEAGAAIGGGVALGTVASLITGKIAKTDPP